MPEPILAPNISPERTRAILVTQDKWANGTLAHYYFFDKKKDGEYVFFEDGTSEWRTWVGEDSQMAVVRKAFQQWSDLGLGLRFEEVDKREAAEIRIGFMQGDGSWSYIGKYCLKIGSAKRTMNFGWDLTDGQDGWDTALHEIGHGLGLPHEHQNPNSGIVWDEEAVYAALAEPPNSWSRQTTYDNIISKLPADTIQGSNWDPDSIMHYPFEAGLIKKPERYVEGLQPRGGISERDKAWVRFFYPPLDDANLPELQVGRSEQLVVRDGEQQNFEILPEATRYYNIRTFGTCDSVIVLFEDANGNPLYLTADDDGGEDRNASLRVKLFQGKRYILRIRMRYSDLASPPTVMMW